MISRTQGRSEKRIYQNEGGGAGLVRIVLMLTACFFTAWSFSYAADPSFKKPEEPLLKMNAVEDGGVLWDKAAKLEIEIRKQLEKVTKDKVPDPGTLGKLCANVTLFNYYIDRLKLLGETAATDWDFRNNDYDTAMNDGLTRLWATPKGEQARQKANQALTKSDKSRMKTLEAVRTLIGNNKLREAELKMDEALVDYYSVAGVLTIAEREQFSKPYEAVLSMLNPKMNAARSQMASDAFRAQSNALVEAYQTSIKELNDAANALAQNGESTFKEKTGPGPLIAETFLAQWGPLHLGLIRATVLDRAAPIAGSPYGGSAPSGKQEDPWAELAKSLTADAMKGIQTLIDTDTKIQSTGNAAEFHAAYLRVLGPYLHRIADETWVAKLDASLHALAKKGNLETAVKNYDEATLDLLRWREKAAAQQAEQAKKNYPELRKKVKDSLIMNENKPGLFRNAESTAYLPTLFCSVPRLMPTMVQQLSDAPVHTAQVVRLEGEKGIWMSQLSSGTYCRLPSDFLPSDASAALAAELLLDAQHFPLNLTTMGAWATSSRSELLSAGGKIEDVALEANASRCANLPAAASPLVSFGKTVSSGKQGQAITGVTLRCSLKPEWVHHRYFFQSLK